MTDEEIRELLATTTGDDIDSVVTRIDCRIALNMCRSHTERLLAEHARDRLAASRYN